MFILLLIIAFESNLRFNGLTVNGLFHYFNLHPFLAMFVLSEMFSYSVTVNHNK